MKPKLYPQNGNALFLILIAVALFAALSYAVTQSGRGAGNIDDEQAMIDAGVAHQCEAMVNHAIRRVKLINGCQEDQISYELEDGTNANSDAPGDERCHLFRPNGGDVVACGSYLDPLVETGQITTRGDTDTVAMTAGGTYFKSAYWWTGGFMTGNGFMPTYSIDGENFMPYDDVCVLTETDPDAGDVESSARMDALCSGACGGSMSHYYMAHSGGDNTRPYYMEADGSLSDFMGETCYATIESLDCDCFSDP